MTPRARNSLCQFCRDSHQKAEVPGVSAGCGRHSRAATVAAGQRTWLSMGAPRCPPRGRAESRAHATNKAGARAVGNELPMCWSAAFRITTCLASLDLCPPRRAHPPLLTWKGAVGGDHQSGGPKDLGRLQTAVELAVRKAASTSHSSGEGVNHRDLWHSSCVSRPNESGKRWVTPAWSVLGTICRAVIMPLPAVHPCVILASSVASRRCTAHLRRS
jgi:hypothetical protein